MCLVGKVSVEVVAVDFPVVSFVVDLNEGVRYGTESLTTHFGLPDGYREEDAHDLGWYQFEIDFDLASIARIFGVVVCEDDGLIRGVAMAGVDEPLLVVRICRIHHYGYDAEGVEGCGGQAESKVNPIALMDVPTAGNDNLLQEAFAGRKGAASLSFPHAATPLVM